MSTKDDGGPAFGQVVALRCVRVEMNGDTEWEPEAMTLGGLSIRDYFAAKALPCVVAKWDEYCKNDPDASVKDWNDSESIMDCIAESAYEVADAMLRARGE